MSHTCHAVGCAKNIPPKMLFCLEHWNLLPSNLKRLIWARYVPGQEKRKDPTPEYLEAMDLAICAVAEKEKAK